MVSALRSAKPAASPMEDGGGVAGAREGSVVSGDRNEAEGAEKVWIVS